MDLKSSISRCRQVSFETAQFFIWLLLALFVGLWNFGDSGEQWLDDGPRYCNNGAMVRDWLKSGQLLSPVQFAEQNYVLYPAHSVPYHPPGYAGLLGMWLLLTDISYLSVRVFTALCLGLTLNFFYRILRWQGVEGLVAFAVTIILGTTPEIAKWSRSAMSEISGMAFIMIATYCFLRSTKETGWTWAIVAFLAAEIAFLCRISTASILPSWFLYLALTRNLRSAVALRYSLPAIAYLVLNACWVKFASQYASNEIRMTFIESIRSAINSGNLTVWPLALPRMVGVCSLAFAMVGVIALARSKHGSHRDLLYFWLLWFASSYVVLVFQSLHFERRYFMYSVPAICALGSGIIAWSLKGPWRGILQWTLLAIVIVVNLRAVSRLPKGLRGYDPVAKLLSSYTDRGNILLSCWSEDDLIFRIRSNELEELRQCIRGDRVLAIRQPNYAAKPSIELAKTPDDVIATIVAGRIRYIVTCAGPLPDALREDRRPPDMRLAHQAMVSRPDLFTLEGLFTLSFDFGKERTEDVYVWRYVGEIPAGESELPVHIPTAGMTLSR